MKNLIDTLGIPIYILIFVIAIFIGMYSIMRLEQNFHKEMTDKGYVYYKGFIPVEILKDKR